MAPPEPPENAYRARAERGEIQLGTWITLIRTPSVLTGGCQKHFGACLRNLSLQPSIPRPKA